MSSNAGELPSGPGDWGFEDWLRLTYSGERFADEVVWPLADDYSRRDWREEAALGQVFLFPARGEHEGHNADVTLRVSTDLQVLPDEGLLEGEADLAIVSTVSLRIALLMEAGDKRRKKVLKAAKFQVKQAFESDPDEYDAAQEALKATYDLAVKKAYTYDFDSQGNIGIDETFIIDDEMGDVIWGVDAEDVEPLLEDLSDEEDPDDEIVLEPEDMELLASALRILKVSSVTTEAFEGIFADPIVTSIEEDE